VSEPPKREPPKREPPKSASRARAIAIATTSAITLFLFAPLFLALLRGEGAWFEWDVSEQYWPDLVYLCGALHDGELPLWNPYDRGGYPFYADPQAAPYHPLNLALCAFGADPPLGFATARVVLGFWLSGLFALGWLRRTGFSWSATTVGAALVQCAPFLRHNWELNLTSALAWLPAMLWALETLVQEKRPRDGLFLALAFAACAWTGSPPALWFASSFVLLYGLARVVREVHETPRGHRVAALRAIGIAGLVFAVFAAGFVAVVFVPGLELAKHSVQAGRDFADLSDGGLGDLSPLLSPKSGNHLYVGLLAFALAPVALRARTIGSGAALVLGALAITLAMGAEGPLFRLAFDHVPSVALFRLPHRYEAWLGPCAALLAAGGIDALATRTLPLRPAALVAGTLLTIAIALFQIDFSTESAGSTADFSTESAGSAADFSTESAGSTADFVHFEHDAGPGLLLLGAATIALAIATRRLTTAALGALLALFVVADVTQALPPERHLRLGPAHGDREAAHEVLRHTEGLGTTHAAMDEFAIGLRAGTRFRFPELRGYQDPLTLASHERVLAALHEQPELAAQFGVAYALQGPHYLHGWDRHFLPRELPNDPAHDRVALSNERSITRLARALPLVYAVPLASTHYVATRQEALAHVRRVAPAPIAVIEAPPPAEGSLSAALPETSRAANHVELGRDRVSFSIDAPAAGVVVINQAWYPGWIAEVDGARAPIWRANGFVRAVPITAGSHHVELRFEPRDAWTRWWLLGTWLATLAWALAWIRRHSRHARS
jgi:hypothetical protein